jgi:hypothetical protein
MFFSYSRVFLAIVLAACLTGMPGPVCAANWLMLQGTEHPLAPAHKFWGFIQPAYTKGFMFVAHGSVRVVYSLED